MRGAGSDLLRKNGGNELPFAIYVEHALDTNKDVVGRTEAYRTAPDDAAIFLLHHPTDGG